MLEIWQKDHRHREMFNPKKHGPKAPPSGMLWLVLEEETGFRINNTGNYINLFDQNAPRLLQHLTDVGDLSDTTIYVLSRMWFGFGQGSHARSAMFSRICELFPEPVRIVGPEGSNPGPYKFPSIFDQQELQIFRGVKKKIEPRHDTGLSWTTDREYAKKTWAGWNYGSKEGRVFTAVIDPNEAVFIQMSHYSERELVVNRKKLGEVTICDDKKEDKKGTA